MGNLFLKFFLALQKILHRITCSNKTPQTRPGITYSLAYDCTVIKYRLFQRIFSDRNFRLSKFPH